MRKPETLREWLCAVAGGFALVALLVPAVSSEATWGKKKKPPASQGNGCPQPSELWALLDPPGGPDYTQWKFMPELDPLTRQPLRFPYSVGELPHGDWVAVFVNQVAFDSFKAWQSNPRQTFEMKEGSILVKENYPKGLKPPSLDRPINNRDGLESVTVMWKTKTCNYSGEADPGGATTAEPGGLRGLSAGW